MFPFELSVDGDFTPWTSWSSCPDTCGRTALRSRERYCTNPAPANGGKNCEGPRFQLKLCKIKHCPGKQPRVLRSNILISKLFATNMISSQNFVPLSVSSLEDNFQPLIPLLSHSFPTLSQLTDPSLRGRNGALALRIADRE